ncbi:MAG TPA: cell filamentation protein Fic [Clostridiales bacterium]|nr:cell filamentation protein Fic [Clostridiales bacterium]
MMDYDIQDDIYCYNNTGVLKNKFNIRDKEKLICLERDLTGLKLIEMEGKKLGKVLDEKYFIAIHKFLFEEILDWAGEYRKVRIHKDNTTFAYPENIKSELKRVFGELKDDNYLKDMDKDILSERLAYYKAEFNIIHPFREGNGRTIRKFIELLAESAGYNLRFDMINKEGYLEIMRKSVLDTMHLKEYIKRQLKDE